MSNIEKQHEGMQISTLDEAMRYAEAMSGAGMIPDKFKRQPANILVAQEIAQTMGESTWVIMSELYFVGAVPTFSAKYMRSRVRQAGHKLRESYDKETGTARAVIIRSDDPDFEHVAEWDDDKARKHDLLNKGHWKKNPELMKKNRAVSEVVREACYEVMAGIAYTTDEARDFVKMDAQRMDQAPASPQHPAQQSKPEVAKGPSEDEWADRLLALEESGEVDKIKANGEWAKSKGFEALAGMAESVLARIARNAPSTEQAVETAQEVLDAEVVSDQVNAMAHSA